MPVRTLIDGRKVNLPEGLTEAQQTNLVLKAFPDAAALAGMSYDIEREYDFNTGVKDFDLRFGNALAGGNPDEIKAEFDNQVGKGNWGVTDFGEVYLTPDGLRAIGQEPKDDRNVLIDSIETDLYDLVDIIPEVVVGTGALAAEFIPVPGTSVAGAAVTKGLLSSLTGRGLIARSARAGFGDAVANVGLEGVQKLRGTQRESLGEVLQDAGTEGLVVGLGSIVLGAPFSAVGGVANRIKSASKDMAPGTQAVRPVQLEEMMEAQRRVAAQVGDDDAMLLSLRTLVGEEGTIAGNILTKIEGVGTKQLGDSFAKKTMDFMNKYRSIVIESRRLGDDELTTLSKLKANLNQSEQQFGKNIVKELSDFNSSAMGKLDNAASTLRGFKDLAQQKLLAQYRQSMKAFDGDEYYGQFKNLDGKIISEQRLANFLTRVSDEAGLSVDDVVNAFGPDSPLHRRITSRIKVKEDGNVVAVKAKRNKKGEATNYQGSSITVQDLLDADKQIRKQSYAKRANFSTVRRNLEISRATQNQISRLSEVPASFQKKLAKVNRSILNLLISTEAKTGCLTR